MIHKIQEDKTSGGTVEIMPPIPSNELTLKPNSILVLRCSRDYGYEELQKLRKAMKNVITTNEIIVTYDDIELSVIHNECFRNTTPISEEKNDESHGYYY